MTTGFADAPQWLINLAPTKPTAALDRPAPEVQDKPEHIEATKHYLETAPVAVEGTGDDQLYRVFCQCRDLGVSREKAIDLVLNVYNPRCRPPWDMNDSEDRDHFHAKSENAWKYGQNSPGAKTSEAIFASAVADFSNKPIPLTTIARGDLDALLDARRFDPANPPAKPVPVLLIGGTL